MVKVPTSLFSISISTTSKYNLVIFPVTTTINIAPTITTPKTENASETSMLPNHAPTSSRNKNALKAITVDSLTQSYKSTTASKNIKNISATTTPTTSTNVPTRTSAPTPIAKNKS